VVVLRFSSSSLIDTSSAAINLVSSTDTTPSLSSYIAYDDTGNQ
jgi:hypothetical protein